MTKNYCGTYKLDENKNAVPCSLEEWGLQLEEMKKNKTKHVADKTINDKRISTVWLGLDHGWDANGEPLLFETMVFDGEDYHDIYCDRYSTWEEAEEGHKKAIEWVNNGCKEK